MGDVPRHATGLGELVNVEVGISVHQNLRDDPHNVGPEVVGLAYIQRILRPIRVAFTAVARAIEPVRGV